MDCLLLFGKMMLSSPYEYCLFFCFIFQCYYQLLKPILLIGICEKAPLDQRDGAAAGAGALGGDGLGLGRYSG